MRAMRRGRLRLFVCEPPLLRLGLSNSNKTGELGLQRLHTALKCRDAVFRGGERSSESLQRIGQRLDRSSDPCNVNRSHERHGHREAVE